MKIKMLNEYISMLEKEGLADVVYGAKNEADFVRMCESALQEAPGWVSERRREYAASAAWTERVSEVQHILDAFAL